MGLLATLASILGIEAEELIDRVKRDAIIWGVLAAFTLVGVVFALVGANAALTLWLGPIWAPLAISGLFLLTAAGIFTTLKITAAIAERKKTERRHKAETTALVTTAAMTALPMVLRTPLMKKVGLPVGAALASVFLLTRTGSERPSHRQLSHRDEDDED